MNLNRNRTICTAPAPTSGQQRVLGRLPGGRIVQSKIAYIWKGCPPAYHKAGQLPLKCRPVANQGSVQLPATGQRAAGEAALCAAQLPANGYPAASQGSSQLPATGGLTAGAQLHINGCQAKGFGTKRVTLAELPSASAEARLPLCAMQTMSCRNKENRRETESLGPIVESTTNKFRLSMSGDRGFSRVQSVIEMKTGSRVMAVITPVRRSARQALRLQPSFNGSAIRDLTLLDSVEDMSPSLRATAMFVPNLTFDPDG